MANEELRRKLAAIQELKAQKYIGTKQAWDYLKEINAIYEVPRKVADSINALLERKGTVHYRATPERILAFNGIFGRILDEFSELDILTDCVVDDDSSFFARSMAERNATKEHVRRFIPAFRKVQYSGAENADIALAYVQQVLDRENLSEELKKALSTDLFSVDWSRYFSDNYAKETEDSMKSAAELNIKLIDRWKKIKNDQLDHRLEYRRELATEYASRYETYENTVDHLKLRIEKGQHKLLTYMMLHEPNAMSEQTRELLHFDNDMLRFITSDKNFLKRYLSS